jgi:hypothetical protein
MKEGMLMKMKLRNLIASMSAVVMLLLVVPVTSFAAMNRSLSSRQRKN